MLGGVYLTSVCSILSSNKFVDTKKYKKSNNMPSVNFMIELSTEKVCIGSDEKRFNLSAWLTTELRPNNKQMKQKMYSLEGNLRASFKLVGNISRNLPDFSAIVFGANVRMLNSANVWATSDAGRAIIYLKDLFGNPQKYKEGVLLELKNYTAGTYKATLRVKIVVDPPSVIEKVQFYNTVKNLSTKVSAKSVETYIEELALTELEMPETFGPEAKGVRIPYLRGESGLLHFKGKIPLPSIAFCFGIDLVVINDAYAENALNQVLMSDNRTLGDLDWWRTLPVTQKARYAVDMVIYPIWFIEYITDFIDKDGSGEKQVYDNFGDSTRIGYWSGDCEDSAISIFKLWMALISCPRSRYPKLRSRGYQGSNPIIKECVSILRRYVPTLSLDAVHGAKASDREMASLKAHLKLNAHPDHFVAERLYGLCDDHCVTMSPHYMESNGQRYPTLFGEGTAYYDSMGQHKSKDFLNCMTVLYSSPLMGGLAKRIYHEPLSAGPFYMGSVMGITPYFTWYGGNFAGFWYMNNKKQRGVTATQLLDQDSGVSLLGFPVVKPGMIELLENLMNVQQPSSDFVINSPGSTPLLPLEDKKFLDSVVEYASNIGKQRFNSSIPVNEVPVLINDYHKGMFTYNNLKEAVRTLPQIVGFVYKVKPVVDGVFGIEAIFKMQCRV